MQKAIVGIFLSAFLVSAQAQDGGNNSLPTIFVAPLDGDVSAIMSWQPALGEGLAEMLITELSRINKFQVLESTALKELVDEIRLGEAGYVGEQEKVDKGGFAGADFMLRGKVTRFGSKSQGVDLGGFAPRGIGGLGVKVTTSDVRIDWRIVDVYARKIIKTGTAVASEKGASFDTAVAVNGRGGNIGFSNHEFMNSALGKAAAKAVTNLVQDLATMSVPESGRLRSKAQTQGKQQAAAQAALDTLKQTPGKVLAVVSKSTLIVSLGSKQGFEAGEKLKLYQTSEVKDDKGNVVFTEEKLVGEVTLEAVQEDRSKAVYAGDLEVKSGWSVKAK
jgi:curli biogenesis system outer membrane secretion channel CsgG